LNLKDLQAFVAVAETGSVSRAAQRLHLTQPAITRRVQNFEAAMGGTPLVDRSAKPLLLTPAGRQVLEHCRDVQAALGALKAGAGEKAEPVGELRIGVGMGTEAVLGAPLDELRRRFPRLELRMVSDWTSRLIDSLTAGNLDVAVAYVTRDHHVATNLQTTQLGTDTIAVVASRESAVPVSRGKALHLRDLSEHRWVLNPVGCAYRLAVQRAHDAAGVPLRVAAEVIGRELQLSLVARCAGVGLLSKRAFASGSHRRTLRIVEVKDFRLESTLTVLRAASLGNFKSAADLLEKRVAQLMHR
jgi:DNA-binding transcriptional LysR family regulator